MIQSTAATSSEVSSGLEVVLAPESTLTSTADVTDKAIELLRGCSYAPVRQVQCRFQRGVLTLSGQVPTFYLKQVAQELLKHMKQVEQIDNRLKVPKVLYN